MFFRMCGLVVVGMWACWRVDVWSWGLVDVDGWMCGCVELGTSHYLPTVPHS